MSADELAPVSDGAGECTRSWCGIKADHKHDPSGTIYGMTGPAPTQAPQADETLAGLVARAIWNDRSPGEEFPHPDSFLGRYYLRDGMTAAHVLATHVLAIRAERESACANCGHVTDDVLSCWCACHRGACRICRRPEVEHRNRNGHGFIATAAPPVSDQTEACVVCGHASGTAQPGLCPAHEYDDGPRTIRADAEQAAERWRKAIASIGYGDNKTEPQISPEEFVREFSRINADAAEWRESQQWRIECHLAGHPDDEDCAEHDPTLRAEQAAARALTPIVAGIRTVLASHYHADTCGSVLSPDSGYECTCWKRDLRAVLPTEPTS